MKRITSPAILYAAIFLVLVGLSACPGWAADEQYGVLTPKPAETPRLNCAKVFGVRPGNPFLFLAAATGKRPMEFSAEGLPEGLKIDPATGLITGVLKDRGEHVVKLRAKNELGAAEKNLKIVVGDTICLTPPLGWNSWNCWAGNVDAEKVLLSAKAMVSAGLRDHGWTYINIDDTWQGLRRGPLNALQSNDKFKDMKGLCDQVHAMGLKIGIYSTPWMTSYAGYCGGSCDVEDGTWTKGKKKAMGKYKFDESDARQWAIWGFDYLKYDWHPNDVLSTTQMLVALRKSGRDIVYSLSNTAPIALAAEWARLANAWRTTGDIRDEWDNPKAKDGHGFQGIKNIWDFHPKWEEVCGPGHWPDPDMLVVGKVGWGRIRPNKLTPNEQYTHITLWSLWSAPMLIGCPLEQADDLTIGLLTNDEVIEVNQDPLGKMAKIVSREGEGQVMVKELEDGAKAVGLFNRGTTTITVAAKWADLKVSGKQKVRDLWRQKDLGEFDGQFTTPVLPHGAVLVKLTPVK